MIGKNIKYFRLSAGLSQDELAKKVGVTKMAISNYENDKREVDSKMLIRIADALKVKALCLLKDEIYPLTITYGQFRKKTNISRAKQEYIYESIHRCLSSLNEILFILGTNILPEVDTSRKIDYKDPESAAKEIRKFLNLPEHGPVGNATDIIENLGIIVSELHFDESWFSGINGTINNRPYIVVNSGMSAERQRFTLIHELAHILINFKKENNQEKIVDDISGAFFFPKEDVLRELGTYRTDIRYDLKSLQREYGISMQSILLRAKQNKVISKQVYLEHQQWLNKLDLSKDEKSQLVPEHSDLFNKLINRGLMEGFINENKASELLGYEYSKSVMYEELQ